MPVPFPEYRWFYPPRSKARFPYNPKSAVVQMWKDYADAIGQFKQNGTNTQLVVKPDRSTELWLRNRYGPDRKPDPHGVPMQVEGYTLTGDLLDRVLSFTPRGVLTVYNVELMHLKTTMVKDTLYFFDVLVWESQHLLGVQYAERYGILHKLIGPEYMPLDRPSIKGGLFIAENLLPRSWDDAWRAAKASAYCEGLVLKRLGGVSALKVGHSENNNEGFMCRIRKPHKNASY